MTTIGISKTNKALLKEYSSGTYDEIINQLLDEIEDELPILDLNSPTSSIKLNKDTLQRLESYSLTKKESYENIIMRILFHAKTLNNIDR